MRGVCKEITHAYFPPYIHVNDFAELNAANKSLFENFLNALLEVSLDLENRTLQTGGKRYNVHLYPVSTPAREEEPVEKPVSTTFTSRRGIFSLQSRRANVGAGTSSSQRPSSAQ